MSYVAGGLGSFGSYGRVCSLSVIHASIMGARRYCNDRGKTKSKGDRGPRGNKGPTGTSKSPSCGSK